MASKKCFKSLLLISFRTMLFLLVDYIDIDDRKRFSFATSPHSHSSSEKNVSSGSDLQNPARYYRVQESPERRLLGTQFYTELNKQFDTPEYYEWQKSNNYPAVQGRSASFNSRYSGAEVESQPYVAGGVAVGPSSVSNQSVVTQWAVYPRTVTPSQQQTNNSVGHYIPPQGWGYGHSSYDWSVSGGYMVPPRVTVAGGAPVAYQPADSHSISQSHQHHPEPGTVTTASGYHWFQPNIWNQPNTLSPQPFSAYGSRSGSGTAAGAFIPDATGSWTWTNNTGTSSFVPATGTANPRGKTVRRSNSDHQRGNNKRDT